MGLGGRRLHGLMVVDLRVDEAEFKDDEGITLMEKDLQV